MVLEAVRIDGKALEHASTDLWEDKELVMVAVRNYKPHVGREKEKDDMEFVASQMYEHILEYLPESMQQDKDIAMAAVSQVRYNLPAVMSILLSCTTMPKACVTVPCTLFTCDSHQDSGFELPTILNLYSGVDLVGFISFCKMSKISN